MDGVCIEQDPGIHEFALVEVWHPEQPVARSSCSLRAGFGAANIPWSPFPREIPTWRLGAWIPQWVGAFWG